MKSLSIVIPCFNEEERLQRTYKELQGSFVFNGLKLKEIIFVNDGSKDKTLKVLQDNKDELKKSIGADIKIVSYRKNKGKGYAVKRGMLASNGDYTLLMDADISTSLGEFRKYEPFVRSGADVVIGTRKNGESTVIVPQPLYRQIMGRVFTYLANIILNTWVSDFTCGFKLFSKDAKDVIFSKTRIKGWGYDSEVLFLAKRLGFEVEEKSVLWKNDNGSKVSIIKDTASSFYELLLIRYFYFIGEYGLSRCPATISFRKKAI